MNKISILGCGWLGLPLAETLIGKGFFVKGSTTSENKIQALQTKNIQPFLIALEPDAVEGDIEMFLYDAEILIIDIPPRFHFSRKIAALIPYIKKSGIQKVLLVSSTSVYADDNSNITEAVMPDPKTDKSKQLFDAETMLQNADGFKTTVLRFGGLIDENRHPVKFLAGQQDIDNPEAPINLIHKTDCIGIMVKIIENDLWGETFNAAAPFHPGREQYYTQKAKDLQLELPEFNHSKTSIGKTIDSQKLQDLLGYTFEFPEL